MASQLLKNSAKLLSGNIFAQAIGFLFYPLLTRLYSPQDFGVLNLFLSIGGMLTLFATADYQYAILLPKSEKKAVSVFQLSALIAVGVTLLCALSVFFRDPIAVLFKAPELAAVYPVLPLFVLLSAFWVLLNYWFTRQSCFGAVAAYQVTQNVGNSLCKYGAGRAGWFRWGLVGSIVVGLVVSLGAVLLPNRTVCRPLFRFDKDKFHLRSAARRYAKFPLFSLPRTIINNISCNLPVFLLTPYFGLAEMGFLGMGMTLAYRPVSMVTASLCQVFFQRMARNVQDRQPVSAFFRRIVLRGGVAVVLVFAGLYLVLPSLTGWLLGAQWETTGHYIRLMLPWLGLTAIGGCVVFVSDLFQKQGSMLAIESVYLLLRAAALLAGIAAHSFTLAILLYSLVSALVIAVQIAWFAILIRRYEKSLGYKK
ncbi:MAG: oligosaccharide flippase family protein [Bacteroides sp.]|nr:oligosaccharide flippase family protein [Bacteroides sp.]MCM1085534.1 oligosaccharide flippase family protein [Bacteroides sp.]